MSIVIVIETDEVINVYNIEISEKSFSICRSEAIAKTGMGIAEKDLAVFYLYV